MRNHYHLVVETPNATLVAGLPWLQSSYTIRLNHRHKLTVGVLSGRYKAQLVDGSGNDYSRTACHPFKLALAARLRRETTLSVWRIASDGGRLKFEIQNLGYLRIEQRATPAWCSMPAASPA